MRTRDENKIQALENATFDLVEESGIANLSINKLAKRAGVSVATTYIYYENKADLLGQLFSKVQENLITQLPMPDQTLTPQDQFATLMRDYAANFEKHPKQVAFMATMVANPEFLPDDMQGEGSLLSPAVLTVIKQAYQQQLLTTANVDIIVAQALQPMQWLMQSRLRNNLSVSEDELNTLIQLATRALFK
ncbi:TetR/AcrR family transcriptional regulator [Weissella confusa]|uniref:TetR/AcrR family transcriptional regulator n=1 Tax=Weissella confusa TaxID=1583 RepID=UPI0022E00411|nr:TetR/AcrR family transcriptional regulator [Weissella confusa]